MFWVAFWQLRGATSSDVPIPWSEIEMWGRAHGLDHEQRTRAHLLVRILDIEFRDHMQKKREQVEKRASKKGKRTGGRRRGRR